MRKVGLEFQKDAIVISRYPLRPGIRPGRLFIGAVEIVEADIQRCVLLVRDELIYLPDWPRAELAEFCSRNGISTRARYDAWSDILAPYVDTSYTKVEVSNRERRLREAGFSVWQVSRLRWFAAIPMIVSQGIAGEWTGLYHYDLMYAVRYLRLFGLYGCAYRAAMRVALVPYQQPTVVLPAKK